MDISNRCRGCLSNDKETLKSLNDAETIQLFEECVRLKIYDKPGMPKNICGICYGKCTAWSMFRQQCLETDDLLNFKFGHIDAITEAEASPADTFDEAYQEKDANNMGTDQQTIVSEFDPQKYEIIQAEPVEGKAAEEHEESEPILEQDVVIEELTEEYEIKEGATEEILEDVYLSREENSDECENDEKLNDEQETHAEEIPPQHETAVFKQSKDLVCNRCNLRFRSIERYVAHSRQHQGLKPEVCKVCSNEFSSSRALRRHMQKHVDTKKHECKICGKRYKFATSLTLHRKHHQNSPKFVCDLCGKTFIRSNELKSHLVSHTTETPLECGHCQKRFKSDVMLRNHVARAHDRVKNFSCSVCSKAFVTGAELKIHIRSHTNQKPYECKHCEKMYKTQSHLAVHVRSVHTTNRPYSCDFCSQSFAHSKVLKCHRLIHTGERPWSCEICKRTFRQKGTLQIHMKTHSKETHGQNVLHSESVVQLPQTLTMLE